MSIRQEWKSRVRDQELFKLSFLVPGAPERRVVLMSPEINALVEGPWRDNAMEERCARLRADFENILAGNRLVVCMDPFEAKPFHQIGRLDPLDNHIFDIRSADPSPGLRIIFHFAEKDFLVTHVCSPRSVHVSWLPGFPLADRLSPTWRKAITESKNRWSTLFPKYEPHQGIDVHDYLSNAVLR